MKKLVTTIIFWVMLLLALPLGALAATYDEYVPVNVFNNSTSDYSHKPILVSVNNTQLNSLGYIASDALDTSYDISSTTENYGVAASNVTFIPSTLGAGKTYNYQYKLGYNPLQTTHKLITGNGGQTYAADSATLEPGSNDYQVDWTGYVDSSVDGYVCGKGDYYGVKVSSGNIIAYQVAGSTFSYNLYPDGVGDYTNISDQQPAATAHWDKVDEVVADDATTYVYHTVAGSAQDSYTLTDPDSAYTLWPISYVTGTYRMNRAAGVPTAAVGIRLGGSETLGTWRTVGSWTTYTDTLARPGGGSWSFSDLASLQVIAGSSSNGVADHSYVTQTYATVYCYPLLSTAPSAIASGVHTIRMTRAGGLISLYVDDMGVPVATYGSTMLSGWSNRKSLVIAHSDDGAQTDYQIKLFVGESSGATGEDVDCGALCQTDFDDLRFTASDGTTLLPYYIQTTSGVTPNQLATVWILVNSIAAPPTDTTIYMYYGNAGAAAGSSLADTFTSSPTYNKLFATYDGADAAVVFQAATGQTTTFADNAQLDTAQYKSYVSSLLLDGTNDWVTYPDSSDWVFGIGNFTIEFWLRFNSLVANQGLFGQYQDAANRLEMLYLPGTHYTEMGGYTGGGNIGGFHSTAYTFATGTWYHIAVVRSGANLYYFVNGSSQALTIDAVPGTYPDLAALFTVGRWQNGGASLDGWVDDFRIVNGAAKYTGNFTPVGTTNFPSWSAFGAVEYLLGGSVPDSSATLSISGGTDAYTESLEFTNNGTQRLWWEPITMYSTTNVADRSGNGNTGNIVWGSNPSGVVISFGSMTPSEATALATSSSVTVPSVMAPPTSSLVEGAGTDMSAFPVYGGAVRMADALGWTVRFTYSIWALITGTAMGFAVLVATGSVPGGALMAAVVFGMAAGTDPQILPPWIAMLFGAVGILGFVIGRSM